MRNILLSTTLMLSACSASVQPSSNEPVVLLETTEGPIEITVYPDRAPISAGDFLRYVDGKHYDGQGFYRVVRADNDPRDMGMSLIQGGRLDQEVIGGPIAHELTTQTGISNANGAVAIARDAPGTGSATYFFINVGNNDFLDTGGTRNSDEQGYATFGRVTDGIDVVKRIQAMEAKGVSDVGVTNGQILTEPVIITRAYRK
ncbi:peptidyl-prolyl cis-trans isomerase [Litorimonas cladophorae]|uniref:peptidylprolyl isomerase n=1 Tax=Litorimonas cladophorae TaxID=1220491 RepID=A0A918KKZ3_9PROT|nr:peptidylprolyl isomerase [Litorimonas cladophorae]GGX66884.1 peptidyl-prolyl cis-trans isomerase [Litorimonas cladophorae]